MKANELKILLKLKSAEFERAMEIGTPREELLRLYRELKELQFQIAHKELSENQKDYA
jgi:hypothetical protein